MEKAMKPCPLIGLKPCPGKPEGCAAIKGKRCVWLNRDLRELELAEEVKPKKKPVGKPKKIGSWAINE